MKQSLQLMWAGIALFAIFTVGFLGFQMVQSNTELAQSNDRIAVATDRQVDGDYERCRQEYIAENGNSIYVESSSFNVCSGR